MLLYYGKDGPVIRDPPSFSQGGNRLDDLSGRTKDRTNTRQGSGTQSAHRIVSQNCHLATSNSVTVDNPSNEKRAVPDSSGALSDMAPLFALLGSPGSQAARTTDWELPRLSLFSPVSLFPHGSSSPLHTTGRFVSLDPVVR